VLTLNRLPAGRGTPAYRKSMQLLVGGGNDSSCRAREEDQLDRGARLGHQVWTLSDFLLACGQASAAGSAQNTFRAVNNRYWRKMLKQRASPLSCLKT